MRFPGSNSKTFRSEVAVGATVRGERRRQRGGKATEQGSGDGMAKLVLGDASRGVGGDQWLESLKVPAVRSEDLLDRKSILVATGLGWISMLLVLNMFLAGVISTLIPGQRAWLGTAFLLALYGGHLFAVASGWLGRGRCRLGGWAVGLFWLGLLGMIPLGALISLF